MIYYIIAALFPILMHYVNTIYNSGGTEKHKTRTRDILLLVAFLPVFLLFVLRDKYIGADTSVYVNIFSEIDKISFSKIIYGNYYKKDVGFYVFTKIIRLVSSNYTFYFFVIGLVIYLTLFFFFRKYAGNPFFAITFLILLGTQSFFETGLRQTLAVCACIWSIKFIINKKIIKYLLCVILAYSFHKSAFIFLITFFLAFINKTSTRIIFFSIITIVFVIMFVPFQNAFNQILGYEYTIEETGNGFIFLAVLIVLFIFALISNNKEEKDENISKVVINLAIICLIFWVLRLISRTAERISYYFIIPFYAFISKSYYKDSEDMVKVIAFLGILFSLILFVTRNIDMNYQFFWGA